MANHFTMLGTFTASEGVEAARAFSEATIIPLHYQDWEHFSESRGDIARAFDDAGLSRRLRWLPAGVAAHVSTCGSG
ncbi:MAG TPA: hypothetical protein VFB54_20130 [Burkholderiales bacterium]|nr:hypothetical protein [Burkholderiales bacterium]